MTVEKLRFNRKPLEQISVRVIKNGRTLIYKAWREKAWEDEERRIERLLAMQRRLLS